MKRSVLSKSHANISNSKHIKTKTLGDYSPLLSLVKFLNTIINTPFSAVLKNSRKVDIYGKKRFERISALVFDCPWP